MKKDTQISGQVLTIVNILAEKLIVDFNYRDETRYDVENLVDLILRAGRQTDPCHVSKHEDDSIHMCRGHRRLKAHLFIKENYPKEFKDIYPDGGIPCIVHENMTVQEEAELKLDHSGQMPLSTPSELYRAIKDWFMRGMSETDIAVVMTPLFVRMLGGRKNPKLYDAAMAVKNPSERRNKLHECWRGRLQIVNYCTQLPVDVELHYLATVNPAEETPVPSVTGDRVRVLYTSFLEDKKNNPNVNKMEPGKCFLDKWDEMTQLDKDSITNPNGTNAKRKSAKEIEEMSNRFTSKAVTKAFQMALGKEVTDLQHFDQLARMMEVVEVKDKKAFNALVDAYTKTITPATETK